MEELKPTSATTNRRHRFRRGKLLSRQQIYSGRIVELTVDRIELEKRTYIREVVGHPGGVVVLGLLPDDTIPFVRQLRYPVNKELLELPAGKIDQGEQPATSAAREFREETGFEALDLRLVSRFYASPGFCTEMLHLYFSRRLRPSRPQRETDEELLLEFYTLEEALAMACRGAIVDAKTLLALYWLSWEKRRARIGESGS